MKDNDSQCKHHHDEEKNKQDAGENNIGEDTFHDVIHEWIDHIIVQTLSDFLFSNIL